jgi:hypothetical protein
MSATQMMYKSYTMNDELKKCRDVGCFALNDVHNYDNNDQVTQFLNLERQAGQKTAGNAGNV